MNMALMKQLSDTLRSYQIYADAFEPGDGDGFILCGHREFLLQHQDKLNAEQLAEMASVDTKIIELASAKYPGNEDDDDVSFMRHTAKLATGEAGPEDPIS
jgi:hypothetical protein